jgi:hypothetical protein
MRASIVKLAPAVASMLNGLARLKTIVPTV